MKEQKSIKPLLKKFTLRERNELLDYDILITFAWMQFYLIYIKHQTDV